MIVGLLATRAALAPKLINSLIIFVAKSAQQDAQNSASLPGLRLSLMAIVNIIQVVCTYVTETIYVLFRVSWLLIPQWFYCIHNLSALFFFLNSHKIFKYYRKKL